jgi:hypothetical protein
MVKFRVSILKKFSIATKIHTGKYTFQKPLFEFRQNSRTNEDLTAEIT